MNGVAMGSPLAPALAEVFLTKIENDFINHPSNPLKFYFIIDLLMIFLLFYQKMKMKMNF